MRRVAVIGVGVTKFGKHERTSAELFAEAAADALLDAELPVSAVQALYYGNVVGSETEHQLHTGPQAASILGIPTIPTTRFEAACASSHAAFRHAVMEIAAGVSDVVLVGGAERVLNVPTPESTEYFAYASDANWEQTLGLTFPGVFALIACAHMQRYGTTEAQMAAVAVKNHKHGALNPKAQFQKEITVEQVLLGADGRRRGEEPQARRAQPEGAVPERNHGRAGPAKPVRRRPAQTPRLLSLHRRRRRRGPRVRGGRAQPSQRRLGARLRRRVGLDAPRRQARPRARARHRARRGRRVQAGGARPGRRGRGRAARLLHDRRDRRDRRARSLRAR